MIYIPLSRVSPGMILAKSVSSPSGLFALLQDGEVLTGRYIKRLAACDIDGIYVEMEGTEDIEPKSIISPKTKQEMTTEFHSLYTNYFNQPYISSSNVKSTKKIAEKIVDSILNREEHLMDMIEIKSYDNYTYSHSLNVGILSAMLAEEVGLTRNRLEDITLCALMHDIGKIDIPIEIINKNGAVTHDEFEVIKTHPLKGVDRMRKCYNLSTEVLPGIQSHHEKIDGSGYPFGYTGTQIPLFGRILAIADVYDALTSQRSYRKAWHPKDALEYIIANSDSQFDCELVREFSQLISVYPTGTLVKLSDGSTAAIVKNHPENIFRPCVRLLEDSSLGEKGCDIDLFEDIRYLSITISSVLGASDSVHFELPSPNSFSEASGK
ncbi:MAG: HD-GYP domain-containing protein [Oscillospiraceae bacterium]